MNYKTFIPQHRKDFTFSYYKLFLSTKDDYLDIKFININQVDGL